MQACTSLLSNLGLQYMGLYGARVRLLIDTSAVSQPLLDAPSLQHCTAPDSTAATSQAEGQAHPTEQLEAMGSHWLPAPAEVADCLSAVGSLCSRVLPMLLNVLKTVKQRQQPQRQQPGHSSQQEQCTRKHTAFC